MNRVLHMLVLATLALLASGATAHEMTIAEMELREASRGEFLWQWTASGNRPASEVLTPVWPEGCRAEVNCCAVARPGCAARWRSKAWASAIRLRW